MLKPLKVFYSWQSDTPTALNRNFIEKAIQKALDILHSEAELEPALREAGAELDKDTKNVPGSPAIADTIFRKIEECTIFVADLTFIAKSLDGLPAKSGKPRLVPNPNVLIEYGYARKQLGTEGLVGVMNTAYGLFEELPFDLRHLKAPISYHLENAEDDEKRVKLDALAETLAGAFKLIFRNHSSNLSVVAKEFIPHAAVGNPATFWKDGDILIAENRWSKKTFSSSVPNEGRAYLRLYPSVAVKPLETEFDAANLARTDGLLRPMGHVMGYSPGRNPYGGIIFHSSQLSHFTQLFLSKEIWGVDADVINKTYWKNRSQGQFNGIIASSFLETGFVTTLQSYMKFAQSILKLPVPLQVEAGLVGVQGYPFVIDAGPVGECLSDVVSWRGTMATYDVPAHEFLKDFFDLIYKKCGQHRPDSAQQKLAEQFNDEPRN